MPTAPRCVGHHAANNRLRQQKLDERCRQADGRRDRHTSKRQEQRVEQDRVARPIVRLPETRFANWAPRLGCRWSRHRPLEKGAAFPRATDRRQLGKLTRTASPATRFGLVDFPRVALRNSLIHPRRAPEYPDNWHISSRREKFYEGRGRTRSGADAGGMADQLAVRSSAIRSQAGSRSRMASGPARWSVGVRPGPRLRQADGRVPELLSFQRLSTEPAPEPGGRVSRPVSRQSRA
jgi:hypothetical protein